MNAEFSGWPEKAFEVLLRLEGEPSAEVRRECRRDREELVRQPMIGLLNAVADTDPAYEDFAVWRYGEVLLQAWQRQGAIIRLAPKIEFAFRLDLDGLEISLAWWYALPAQIERYRAAVANPVTGPRLVGVLGDLEGFTISGDTLKRPLRGYPPDHPRAELLRHRSLIATRAFEYGPWIHTSAALDRVLTTLSELRPLAEWLTVNVAR